jgi:predicted RND superfamily exporter protein
MRLLHTFRYPILLLLLVSAYFLFPHLRKAVHVDNSLTGWFIEGDPALESYHRFLENFGNDEIVIVLFEPNTELLEEANINALKNFAEACENHPDVAQVFSAHNAIIPSIKNGIPSPRPLLKENISQEELKLKLARYPFLKEQFFTSDFSAAKFIIYLKNSPDFGLKRKGILKDLYAYADVHLNDDRSYFGGVGVIFEALNELSEKEFSRFLLVGYLLMFIVLLAIYRNLRFVLLALATIFFSTYFTLGIYGAMGHQLNLLSTLIPAIIILLCVMDVMHILNEYQSSVQKGDKLEDKLGALKTVWWPCLFTSLTTMAGFISLSISPVKILVSFGIYTALGIALGLLFSFLFAVLLLAPAKRTQAKSLVTKRQLLAILKIGEDRPKQILMAFGGLSLLALLGITTIKVDTDSLAYLPNDHWVQKDNENIKRLVGPYMPLEYLITVKEGLKTNSPEVLTAMQKFEEDLQQKPFIGSVNGLHDIYRAAFKERYKEDWRRGFNKKGIIKNVSDYSEILNPQLMRNFSRADHQMARISIAGEIVTAGQLAVIMDSIQQVGDRNFKGIAKVEASGYQSLYAGIVNYVTESQVKSFSLAVLLIFILLFLFLRDLKLALLSLIPNFFPIISMLGCMGFFGINLDTATAAIASIVLSFSIDDTMHFAYHYRRLKNKGRSAVHARRATISHVGKAIILTSTVLFAGYFLMLLGELKTVLYFGILTSISIVAALLSQLFLFPILLAKFDK